MAQMYAANSLNGIVVDVGEDKTDITPISDGFILHHIRTTISLGIRDCQNYLAHLLRSNQSVVSTLSPPSSPLEPEVLHSTLLELVKQIWTEGHVKVPSDGETALVEDEGITDIAAIVVAGKEKAVIESGMKKKATAKASAAEQARAREIEALDLVTITFREHSLTLGKERHRFCEPLFDPTLLKGLPGQISDAERSLPLQEAVGLSVGQADIDQRQSIWSGLLVTGDLTRHIRGKQSWALGAQSTENLTLFQALAWPCNRALRLSLQIQISNRTSSLVMFALSTFRNTILNTETRVTVWLVSWVQVSPQRYV